MNPMREKLHYTIHISCAGMSVGRFLRAQGYSRHIMTWLKSGDDCILVNGTPVFTNYLLQEGDCLTVRLPRPQNAAVIPPSPVDFPWSMRMKIFWSSTNRRYSRPSFPRQLHKHSGKRPGPVFFPERATVCLPLHQPPGQGYQRAFDRRSPPDQRFPAFRSDGQPEDRPHLPRLAEGQTPLSRRRQRSHCRKPAPSSSGT